MDYMADRTEEMTGIEATNTNRVRNLASECAVLLENDGTLPLPASSNIALYGSGARHTIKGGTGSGDVNSRHEVMMIGKISISRNSPPRSKNMPQTAALPCRMPISNSPMCSRIPSR